MQAFVSDYLQPICRLLVYLSPLLLVYVAQADRINFLLCRANNRLSYEYLVWRMKPQRFPWHYDPCADELEEFVIRLSNAIEMSKDQRLHRRPLRNL